MPCIVLTYDDSCSPLRALLAAHGAVYLAGESPVAGIAGLPRSHIRRLLEVTLEVKART